MRQRFPDFFCIGVQKAGTTWLYENLSSHKSFWLPFLKEVDFFNFRHLPNQRRWIKPFLTERCMRSVCWTVSQWRDTNSVQQLDWIKYVCSLASADSFTPEWYGRVFAPCPVGRLCGDITPEYSLLSEEGIHDILSFSPDAKFILMLRDPIERDFSHARMYFRDAEELRVGDVLEFTSNEEVKQRSDYPNIIDRWLRVVAEGRLKVCFSDEIVSRPRELLVDIARFLGARTTPEDWPRAGKVVHPGRPATMPDEVRNVLRDRHRDNIANMAERYPDPCRLWQARHYGGTVLRDRSSYLAPGGSSIP